MLVEEGGVRQLEMVRSHLETHKDVLKLTENILDSLQKHQTRTGQLPPQRCHTLPHKGKYTHTPRHIHTHTHTHHPTLLASDGPLPAARTLAPVTHRGPPLARARVLFCSH